MYSRRPAGSLASRSPSPPSPRLASNLDSAFPYFPTKKLAARNGSITGDNSTRPPPPPPPPPSNTATTSNTGPSLFQKMKTLGSGPFGGGKVPPQDQSEQESRATEVARNPSAPGPKQFRNQEGRAHFRKRSDTASLMSQPSVRSVASVDRYDRTPSERSEFMGSAQPPPMMSTLR